MAGLGGQVGGRTIKAVTLDAGDTLLHLWVPKPQRFAYLCDRAGVARLTPASAYDAAKKCEEVWQQRPQGDRDRQWWIGHNVAGLKAAGVTGDINAMAEQVYAVMETLVPSWVIEEGVLETLDRVRHKGYQLAVVSNWDGSLDTVLTSLGIRDYFQFVADSEVVGYRKPDVRLYQTACDALGVHPEECLHVGDSIRADGLVAKTAGAQFILYDPLSVFTSHSNRIVRLAEMGDML